MDLTECRNDDCVGEKTFFLKDNQESHFNRDIISWPSHESTYSSLHIGKVLLTCLSVLFWPTALLRLTSPYQSYSWLRNTYPLKMELSYHFYLMVPLFTYTLTSKSYSWWFYHSQLLLQSRQTLFSFHNEDVLGVPIHSPQLWICVYGPEKKAV